MPYRKNRKQNLKKVIKGQLEKYIEKKTKVYEYYGSITDNLRSPLDVHVTSLPGGVGQSARIGNRVNITSLKYDLFFTAADTTNSIRCIFYIPKNQNELMTTGTALGFNKAPDLDRYNILKDMLISVSNNGPACVRRQGWVRFNRGIRSGHKERYDGENSTDVVEGMVHVYMVSDSGAVSDPQVNGYIRTFFTDS